MIRTLLPAIALVLAGAIVAYSQGMEGMKMGSEKPATLMSGLGSLHHPVTTGNDEAQRYFDQGLSLIYAFNHEEAVRSFQRAAALDPQMAMAHWGIALALGPNINQDVDPNREKAAYEAVQKAVALSGKASDSERAYINALAKRYSINPKTDLKKLAVDYKVAMGEVSRSYPDDLDAATLYAESAMDLRPWALWSLDGKPAEGTEEIVAVLESVLRRNPDHPGAIHYYIHAVEASPHPERALAYAPRLGQLMPSAGHLVHMPAHIYQRVGDFDAAARSNVDAAAADRAYMAATGARGVYPLMYYSHNLHFLAIASCMEGRFSDAIKAAQQLEDNVRPGLKMMPEVEGFLTVMPLILVRFNRWDDIAKLPQPDPSLFGINAVWHFSRGFAFASRGDAAKAEAEHREFRAWVKKIPANAPFGLNPASMVLSVADNVLSARIATAKGDNKTATDLLRKAVEIEDALAYDEPPTWFMPVREMLGGALIKQGDFAGAEQVFREDLQRNRRNGRSLFGLAESLRGQKKDYAAALVEREQETAWKNADVKLSVADLWQ